MEWGGLGRGVRLRVPSSGRAAARLPTEPTPGPGLHAVPKGELGMEARETGGGSGGMSRKKAHPTPSRADVRHSVAVVRVREGREGGVRARAWGWAWGQGGEGKGRSHLLRPQPHREIQQGPLPAGTRASSGPPGGGRGSCGRPLAGAPPSFLPAREVVMRLLVSQGQGVPPIP